MEEPLLKVLYIAAAAHVAGGNRFLLNLFEATKHKNVASIVVVPGSGNMETEAVEQGVIVESVELIQPSLTSPIKSIIGYLRWRKLINKHKPDLIHANDFWTARSVCKAAASLSIPLVVHVHFKQNADFCKWVFKRLPSPNAFIFCSHATKRDTGPALTKNYPKTHQYVVHNSVNTNKFCPKSERKLSENRQVNRVGMIANIIPRKRIEDFISVAHKICKDYPELRFEIIGAELDEGKNYAEKIRKQIHDLHLEEQVILLGFQSDVASFIEKWDVAFCCAEHEELPISLIEAASSGLPLISTNVGGISEIIDEEKTGFMLNVGDIDGMHKQLVRLIEDDTLYINMSNDARESSQRKFHPEMTSEEMLEIYRSVV